MLLCGLIVLLCWDMGVFVVGCVGRLMIMVVHMTRLSIYIGIKLIVIDLYHTMHLRLGL